MKVLLGGVVATLLFVGAAVARQTTAPAAPIVVPPSRCAAPPEAPSPPDPATASAASMQIAIANYDTWRGAMQAVLDCRHAEATEFRAAADARTTEYNAANAMAHSTSSAWTAAGEAYTARHPARRH